MDDLAVYVKSLRHVYQDRTEVRAEGIPFRVRHGEKVALIGATGTGKTTMFKHILGLLQPTDGDVRVLGCDPYAEFAALRRQVSAVFQNPDEQIIGPTVFDDIAFALRAQGMKPDLVQARVQAVAERLQLGELLRKIPHYLSGGQKQKVALAGAIAIRPRLLVLDEPFSGLDGRTRNELVAWLRSLNEADGITIVFSTHDLELVSELADRVYVLHHGHLVLCGTPAEVLSEVEALRSVDLEPPSLVQLFHDLSTPGQPVPVPVRLAEARQTLQALISERRSC